MALCYEQCRRAPTGPSTVLQTKERALALVALSAMTHSLCEPYKTHVVHLYWFILYGDQINNLLKRFIKQLYKKTIIWLVQFVIHFHSQT